MHWIIRKECDRSKSTINAFHFRYYGIFSPVHSLLLLSDSFQQFLYQIGFYKQGQWGTTLAYAGLVLCSIRIGGYQSFQVVLELLKFSALCCSLLYVCSFLVPALVPWQISCIRLFCRLTQQQLYCLLARLSFIFPHCYETVRTVWSETFSQMKVT